MDCGHKGMHITATTLKYAVAFKLCLVGIKAPNMGHATVPPQHYNPSPSLQDLGVDFLGQIATLPFVRCRFFRSIKFFQCSMLVLENLFIVDEHGPYIVITSGEGRSDDS